MFKMTYIQNHVKSLCTNPSHRNADCFDLSREESHKGTNKEDLIRSLIKWNNTKDKCWQYVLLGIEPCNLIEDIFEAYKEEFCKFTRIPEIARTCDSAIVCGLHLIANRMKFPQNITPTKVICKESELKQLTKDDIIFLLRCGISYDKKTQSLTF